jgi:environmental stress-induced protein Ves
MIPAPCAIDDLPMQAWANGGGSTVVLACDATPAWTWRVSIATIDVAGPFSVLADTRRQFAALDQPLALLFATRRLDLRRLQVLAFDGTDAPLCELTDGPTRAINLMLRGDAEATLITRPLVGSMMLPGGHAWLVLVIAGHATVSHEGEGVTLAQGQYVALPAGRALLEGGGEIALVRFG